MWLPVITELSEIDKFIMAFCLLCLFGAGFVLWLLARKEK